MYIHLGSDTAARDCDIIGVFDIENTSVSKSTKEFLSSAGRRKTAVYVSYEMPRSFTVATVKGKERVYISNVSSSTIIKRSKEK